MARSVPSRICNQPDVTLQNAGFGVCNVVATYHQGYTSGGMGLDFWTRVHQPHHAQSMERLSLKFLPRQGIYASRLFRRAYTTSSPNYE